MAWPGLGWAGHAGRPTNERRIVVRRLVSWDLPSTAARLTVCPARRTPRELSPHIGMGLDRLVAWLVEGS